MNTSKFGSEQTAYDGFARAPLIVNVALDEPAANAVLHYTATGHGGHGTGDEFVRCEHHVTWDGDTCLSFTPWRDDCASSAIQPHIRGLDGTHVLEGRQPR